MNVRAADRAMVIFTMPEEFGSALIAEGIGVAYDPYRGVDVPIEVIVGGLAVGGDLIGLAVDIPHLSMMCGRLVSRLRRRPVTRLALRRKGLEVSLAISGEADEKAVRKAIDKLLELADEGNRLPEGKE